MAVGRSRRRALLGVPASGAGGGSAAGCGDVGQPRVRDARRRRRAGSPRASSTASAARTCSSSPAASASRRYDVSDPEDPQPLDTLPAARAGRERLLAERGHGARHAPQADHRRARPAAHRARRRRPARRTAASSYAELQERLLRHLLRRPGEPASRSATSSRCRRATRRAASRTAATSGPAVRRGAADRADLHPSSVARADPRPDRARPELRLQPATSATAGRSGSPTCATRTGPQVSDEPIDLWRNDGYTDYSHDVDEDEQGIAWVSGRGGIRGYATQRPAPRPVPEPRAAGRRRSTRSSSPAAASAGTAQPVMLMHNSGRPTDGSVRASGRQEGQRARRHRGGLHRAVRARAARSSLSDLTDSWGGEPAQRSTLTRAVPDEDARHVPPVHRHAGDGEPGRSGCSAHYFEIEGSMLGAAWYGQGLRLLDISDARDVRQVGYYRVTGHRRRRRTRRRTRGTWRSGRTARGATCSTCST